MTTDPGPNVVTITIASQHYYHGGVAGLRPGDFILPPAATGAKSLALDSDIVWVAANLAQAALLAIAAGGWVYEVWPEIIPLSPEMRHGDLHVARSAPGQAVATPALPRSKRMTRGDGMPSGQHHGRAPCGSGRYERITSGCRRHRGR